MAGGGGGEVFDEELYPAPRIQWYPNAYDQHPSLVAGLSPKGLQLPPPRAPPAPGSTGPRRPPAGSGSGTVVVDVKNLSGMTPSGSVGDGEYQYYVTAHYPFERQELIERRKTMPARAVPSAARPSRLDCALEAQITLPVDPLQQFVTVAIFESGPSGDVQVGESLVPVADPKAASIASWPVLWDFEQVGSVTLLLRVPPPISSITTASSIPGGSVAVSLGTQGHPQSAAMPGSLQLPVSHHGGGGVPLSPPPASGASGGSVFIAPPATGHGGGSAFFMSPTAGASRVLRPPTSGNASASLTIAKQAEEDEEASFESSSDVSVDERRCCSWC